MDKKYVTEIRAELQKQRVELLDEAEKTAEQDLNIQDGELADTVDRSSAETDRSFTIRLRDRERQLLKKIDEALERLDEGIFGECSECGETISMERLKARPVATLCIDCKEEQERKEKQI